MPKAKRLDRLEWDGDRTTDGRYEIGRMTDVSGESVWYLGNGAVPCASIEEVKEQAQAFEDGTIDEFESARQVPLRALRAERAEGEAERFALLAYARRVDADGDLTAAQLKRRRKAAITAAERQVEHLQAMFDAQYREDD